MSSTILFLLLVSQTNVAALCLGLNSSSISHTIASWHSNQDAFINITDRCRLNLKENSSVRCTGLKKWDVMSDTFLAGIINLDLNRWKSWKIRNNEFCNGTGTCPKKLQALKIRDSRKLSWIKSGAFDGLDVLTTLVITNTHIKQFAPHFFAGLEKLKRLDLTTNRIRFIRNIEQDPKTIPIDPQDILPSLKSLALDGNPLWTIDDGFFSTFNTDNVEKISMRSCNLIEIGDQSFCTLKSLQMLDLHGNPNVMGLVADAFQCAASNNSGLATLSLSNNKMKTKDIITILQMLSASLTTVYLDRNAFRVLKSYHFPHMKVLGILSLSFCEISHIMPKAFANLPNLQELNLQGNYLLFIPGTINAPNLLYLNMDRNRVQKDSKRTSSVAEKIDNFFHFTESSTNLPKLRKLTLNWVTFKKLNRSSFKGLLNLTTLELKHTTVQEIEDYTFEETPRLSSLDLSGSRNLIIRTNYVFSGLYRLKVLNLSKYSYFQHFLNTIDRVEKTIFSEAPFQNLYGLSHLDLTGHDLGQVYRTFLWGLFRLENLVISSANISSWKVPMFNNFPILRQIDLSFNDIGNLSKDQIEDLRSMDVVNLSFNPLSCSCSILSNLDNLITDYNVSLIYVDSQAAYTCQVESLDETVSLTEALQYYQKACSHKQITVWMFHYAIILVPFIAATAAVIVIWRGRNVYYLSYLFYIKFKKTRLSGRKNVCTYDAFVCYSELDGEWLYGEMQRNLESRGIQLCLRERDFILGRSKIENLIDAVERSQKIILVLSPAFVNSRWCLFEADIAQQRLVQDAATNIVVINLEHVHSKALPSYLRYIVKTRTHINWPSDSESRPLFWAKLVRSIRKNSTSVSSSTNSISSEA